MKFSENWLRQHVPNGATRDELGATLTAIGLEVEAVTPLGEALDGVVVGRIVEVVRHPEADRLQVCRVDVGADELLQIVCGAPNARVGLAAPVALVGATLPGGMAIGAASLRGVESAGMLCSAKELGLDVDASGLLELPSDAPAGSPLADYLLLPDASIEIKLTPNRADCFSVRGIAYDVAAATGTQVSAFDIAAVPSIGRDELTIELHARGDAPRFCGRVIEGVDATRPTPVWMSERLRRSGVRPISLLVDITQYVMLELGQPMHAYDRDTLRGPISVRRARDGETLQLLDGREVTLDTKFVVVADGDRAVGLGGLMGGMETRVTDATRNVFLEAAHFAPDAIIGRGRRLGLHTDASHRFERGVDPDLPRQAIEYATRLLLDTAGGAPSPVTEATLAEFLPRPQAIRLRRARLARVLGVDVPDVDVERMLRALGLAVDVSESGWSVTPPTRRFDLAIEEDLIEEVARIHGYDAIPSTLPSGVVPLAPSSETQLDTAHLRRQMSARDYLEAINYAFVDATLLERWSLHAGSVALANPLSAEMAVMRTSLLPGLVAALSRNVARQQSRVRLFELGNVFHAAQVAGDAPVHTQKLAAVATGDTARESWSGAVRSMDFDALKGDLQSLAALSGAQLGFEASTRPWGHPGRSADISREGVVVGWIGQLHPGLQQTLGLDAVVVAFEIDLAAVHLRAVPRAQALSRFPSVRRDLAFVVPQEITWGAIETSVRAAAGPSLRELVLFDVYTGTGVETGFKSVAMGLILQDQTRTLADRDVDAVVDRVVEELHGRHGATIRS